MSELQLVSFKVVIQLKFLKRSLLLKGFAILISYRLVTIYLTLMLDFISTFDLAR